jgi:hypothetical protein
MGWCVELLADVGLDTTVSGCNEVCLPGGAGMLSEVVGVGLLLLYHKEDSVQTSHQTEFSFQVRGETVVCPCNLLLTRVQRGRFAVLGSQ